MNPWIELDRQSAALESWQLLLMLVFLLGYVVSIGGLLARRTRVRAAAVSAVSGVALCVLSAPWVLGALMLALAIGAVGLFTGLVVVLSRVLGVDRRIDLVPSQELSPDPGMARLDEAPGAAPRGAVHAAAPLTVI